MSDIPRQDAAAPDPAVMMDLAYRRGLLQPQDRAMYEQAMKRGFIKPPAAPAGAPAQSYDTKLSPDEETAFGAWKGQHAPQDSGEDYDLRGAFKAGLTPDPATGHWADTYKKPNHPTFSDQSMYATGADKAKAGRWEGEKFIPPAPVPDAANPLGAMGSAITRAPGELRRQQESFTARAKAAEEADRLKQGYEPGVDYESGTTFGDRIQMTRMDNPAEQRAMLEGRYGAGNVFQDKGGRFYVQTPAGPKVAPTGEGMATNLLASIYGKSPQIVGETGGALLGAQRGATVGAMAGPKGAAVGGVLGGLAGSGLGSMLAKSVDEFIKGMFGQGRKTPGDMAVALGNAGVEGVVGEGAGRIVTQIPGAIGRGFRKHITGATPETVGLAKTVADAGGVAPLRSATPGLTSGIQKQDISAKLGSDFLDEPNRWAVKNRLLDIIESAANKTPDQIRLEFGEVLNPAARIESQTTGAPIVGAVRQHAAQLEGEVANLGRDADRALTAQLGRLNALSRRAPAGALGEDLAAGIAQARSTFSAQMQKIYSKVDEMITPAERVVPPPPRLSTETDKFGVPVPPSYEPAARPMPGVVPTALMKKKAGEILDGLPKDAAGNPIFGDARVLRSLSQMRSAPEKWTLGEAQAARSTLGEFSAFTDMTPGVAKRQFDDLRIAVDRGMQAAALDPAAAPAIRLLRTADRAYSEGIRKFEDATINSMVSQARTGIMPDPGKVAEMVLRPGQTSRAATIKRMVDPDTWNRVAAADWENNIIGPATDKATGDISAIALAKAVAARDRGGLLELTYGPAIARDIRLYSKRMDVRGGKVPAENLAPDTFGQTMRQLEVAQREQDAFLKTNYLSELADPKRPRNDSAVSFILRPGEESRLVEAQRFFGDDSPQMAGVRDQARKELLNSAVIPTTTGAGTTISGEGIETALARWTPKQQEILFPGQVEDMKRLAKEIRFMFPATPDQMSGGLIAGAVKDAPLFGSMKGAASGALAVGGLGAAAGMLGGPAGAGAGAIIGAAIGAPLGLLAGGRLAQLAYYNGMAWIYSQPRVVRMLSEGLKPGPGKAATRETIRMIFRAAAAGQLDDDQPAQQTISEQITGARHARP